MPGDAHQNKAHSLPAILTPEQITYLLRKGVIQLLDGASAPPAPSAEEVAAEKQRVQEEKAQQERYDAELKKRKAELLEKFRKENLEARAAVQEPSSPAAEGNAEENACEKGKQKKKKKHKRMDANSADLKPEQVEELKKLSEEAAEHGPVVHIPLTGMRSFARPDVTSKWTFPTTAFERLRCEVFADLTDRGFYVTNAAKFGGHFLVYSGDPLCFHAEYIVLLSLPDAPLPIHDLVSLARLGVSVKKSAVIASFNSSGRVTYFTFEWQGITSILTPQHSDWSVNEMRSHKTPSYRTQSEVVDFMSL